MVEHAAQDGVQLRADAPVFTFSAAGVPSSHALSACDGHTLRAEAPEFTPVMRVAPVSAAPRPFSFQAIPVDCTPAMYQFQPMTVTSSTGAPKNFGIRSTGKVLQILGKYGWISPLEHIDHPEAWRNGGRIYFGRKDVIGTNGRGPLCAGALVSFDVYADDQGLGACKVRVEDMDEDEEETFAENVEILPFEALDKDGCASWDLRNLAASTKIRAEVGDDIRWDLILDTLADIVPAAGLRALPSALHGAKAAASGGGASTRSHASSSYGSSRGEINSDSEDDDVRSSHTGAGAATAAALARPPPGLLV